MGDGKVKLGRGPYAISTAILSIYAGFQHPGTKYMPQYLQDFKSWLNQVQNT